MNARLWLRTNGYGDIADLIDGIQAEWKANRRRTRRDWWEVLAGDKKGASRVIEGREFPVLRAAQVREGLPITRNAIQRTRGEVPPPVRVTSRWRGTAETLTQKGIRRRRGGSQRR